MEVANNELALRSGLENLCELFPTLDKELVRDVLVGNEGSIENSVDQLFQLLDPGVTSSDERSDDQIAVAGPSTEIETDEPEAFQTPESYAHLFESSSAEKQIEGGTKRRQSSEDFDLLAIERFESDEALAQAIWKDELESQARASQELQRSESTGFHHQEASNQAPNELDTTQIEKQAGCVLERSDSDVSDVLAVRQFERDEALAQSLWNNEIETRPLLSQGGTAEPLFNEDGGGIIPPISPPGGKAAAVSSSSSSFTAPVPHPPSHLHDAALAESLWNQELERVHRCAKAKEDQNASAAAAINTTAAATSTTAAAKMKQKERESSQPQGAVASTSNWTAAFRNLLVPAAQQKSPLKALIAGTSNRIPATSADDTQSQRSIASAPKPANPTTSAATDRTSAVPSASGHTAPSHASGGPSVSGPNSTSTNLANPASSTHQSSVDTVEECRARILQVEGGQAVLAHADKLALAFCRVQYQLKVHAADPGRLLQAWRKTLNVVVDNLLKELLAALVRQAPLRQRLVAAAGGGGGGGVVEGVLAHVASGGGSLVDMTQAVVGGGGGAGVVGGDGSSGEVTTSGVASSSSSSSFSFSTAATGRKLVDAKQTALMRRCLEAVVMDLVRSVLWPEVQSITQDRDRRLKEGLSTLKGQPSSRLGVNPTHAKAVGAELAGALQVASGERTPREMAAALFSCIKTLTAQVQALSGPEDPVTADDLLPLTAWLVLQAHAHDMFAVLQYVEVFLHLHEQPISGELSYTLTNYTAACEWLANGAPGIEEVSTLAGDKLKDSHGEDTDHAMDLFENMVIENAEEPADVGSCETIPNLMDTDPHQEEVSPADCFEGRACGTSDDTGESCCIQQHTNCNWEKCGVDSVYCIEPSDPNSIDDLSEPPSRLNASEQDVLVNVVIQVDGDSAAVSISSAQETFVMVQLQADSSDETCSVIFTFQENEYTNHVEM